MSSNDHPNREPDPRERRRRMLTSILRAAGIDNIELPEVPTSQPDTAPRHNTHEAP
jgi:hypothetical protein